MDLVTIPRVPICRTGHYELESGPIDFALEHFTAAAEALVNDPAVLPGRIRLELPNQGHLAPDGITVEASGGSGGPAVGWMDNYAVDGNTLYADLHVPELVAASMDWAFPGRSIEGLFGYTTATGQRHDFMATGLLLLGTSWPGVTTLPDFAEVQAQFMAELEDEATITAAGFAAPSATVPEATAVVARIGASARPPASAREQLVTAGLNVSDLRLRWYGAEADGELEGLPDSYDYSWWYVAEVRADDDGTLYVLVIAEDTGVYWRFDVASIDGSSVTFAEPTPGSLDWQPQTAAASGARPVLAAARWGSRAESRAPAASHSSPPTTTEDDTPMTDAQRQALATSLGLDPATATEAEVHAAAAERAAADPPTPPAGGGDPDPVTPPEGDVTEPVPAGVTASTATVSAQRLADLEARAARGDAAAARQVAGDRDRLVLAALEDGRIMPAEAGLGDRDPATGLYAIAEDGWRRYLEDAPEVTARALENLARGKYPGATARTSTQPQTGQRDSLNRVLASVPGLRRKEPTA